MEIGDQIITNKELTIGLCCIKSLSKEHQSTAVRIEDLMKVLKSLKNLGLEVVRLIVENESPLILSNKEKKVGLVVAGCEE